MNQWTTYCFGNFQNLSFDHMLLKTAKMSYMETLIMYVGEIILYLGLALIIQSYKDSGLPFFLYIKSFFVSVSRKEINNLINQENENINNKNNNISKKNKFEKHFQALSEINKEKSEENEDLKLLNVTKSFGELKAVNNLNCEFFSD